MITESTYSQTEQISREQSERDLLEYAYEVIERGGTCSSLHFLLKDLKKLHAF